MPQGSAPCPQTAPELWPWSLRLVQGAQPTPGTCTLDDYTLAGRPLRDYATSSPRTIVIDHADAHGQANVWATALGEEFWDGYGMSGGYVLTCGWAVKEAPALDIAAQTGVMVLAADLNDVGRARESGVPAADIRLLVDEASVASVCAQRALDPSLSDMTLVLPSDPATAVGIARRIVQDADQYADDHYVPWRVLHDARGRQTAGGVAESIGAASGAAGDASSAASDADSDAWQALLSLIKDSPALRCVGVVMDAPTQDIGAWSEQLQSLERHLLVDDGWTTVLVETRDHSAVETCDQALASATQCARRLAETVRTVCRERDVRVPRVEYLPSPGIFAHSTLLIDSERGRVEPMIDQVGALRVVWTQ